MAEGVLRLLFPPLAKCMGCGSLLGANENWLCEECEKLLHPLSYTGEARCLRCGMPLKGRGACGTCGNWGARSPAFARCAFVYSRPIRGMLRAFKYGGVRRMAPELGRYLSDLFIREAFEKPDALVPVPMHPKRLRRRGFNQALLLARELGERAGIAVWEDRLIRLQNTPQQARLRPEERRAMRDDVFRARDVAGARVLLVDDVLTTGATACACAWALYEAGAAEVQLIALAGAQAKNMKRMRQKPQEG